MRISLTISLFTLLAAGCGSTTTDPHDMGMDMPISTVVPTNFASINSEILQPTCANFSVCHSPEGKFTANALDLKDDGTMSPGVKAYMALINQPSVNKKAKAMNLLRVKPCDATDSFMQMKLEMTTDLDKDTDFGHHMPDVAGEFLTPAQVKAIGDWINRGAIMDEPTNVSGSTCQLNKDMGPVRD
jgi:hypothetical protein